MNKSKSVILWTISLVLMVILVIYQRATGPTYPKKGDVELSSGAEVEYRLLRSYGGDGDAIIELEAPENVSGTMEYKRYKSHDEWHTVPLDREGDFLVANIPHQPPAGKVMYKITLVEDGREYPLTNEHVIIRFKGHVPEFILWPHIFFMFFSLVIAFRTGLEALFKGPKTLKYSMLATVFLGIGGLILGPIVQWYAFGAFWTGWPFGHDLTDNKTLISFIFWLIAIWRLKKNPNNYIWVYVAVIVALAIYLIPHSVLGSEIDHTKIENVEQINP